MRVLILGAGGHAQVIADILLQMGRIGADMEEPDGRRGYVSTLYLSRTV